MTEPINVLVAEDDPDIREVVTFKLERAGFLVTAVDNGIAARDALAGGAYHVAVLDVMMPGMNGLDVLEQLRVSQGANTRVLMLTARARDVDVDRGFMSGADDYLTKPFVPNELVRRVAALGSRP